MRIFFLPTSYPSEEHPQKNSFIYEQAKELANLGHEIVILHINKLPTRSFLSIVDGSIKRVENEFSIEYRTMQKTLFEDKFILLNKNAFINNAERLYQRAVSETGEPDVIYAHFSCWAGYAGAILSKKYKVPLVTTEHFGKIVSGNTPKKLLDCIEYVIENSDEFICVSEQLRKAILSNINTKNKPIVISNMVDKAFHYSAPKQNCGEFNFCAIGRLTAPKNYELLILAFVRAFSGDENIKLRIGGDGEELPKLKKLVKKHGREGQILFLGGLSRGETINEYVNCDAFALASLYETYGIVYREALAIGRPIVTTNHGGFSKEDWHDEYGYMVPNNDVDAFAKALRMMVDNISDFDGENISKLCLQDCSSESVGKRIESVLLNVRRSGK